MTPPTPDDTLPLDEKHLAETERRCRAHDGSYSTSVDHALALIAQARAAIRLKEELDGWKLAKGAANMKRERDAAIKEAGALREAVVEFLAATKSAANINPGWRAMDRLRAALGPALTTKEGKP